MQQVATSAAHIFSNLGPQFASQPLSSTMVPSISRTALDCLQEYSLRYLKERQTYSNMFDDKSGSRTDAFNLSSTILSISREHTDRFLLVQHMYSSAYVACMGMPCQTVQAGDLAKADGTMLACEQIGNKIKELDNGIASIMKRRSVGIKIRYLQVISFHYWWFKQIRSIWCGFWMGF